MVSNVSFSLLCCGLHISEQHRDDFDRSLRSDPGSAAEDTRTCLGKDVWATKALQCSAHAVEALWLLEKRGNPKAAILVNNTQLAQASMPLWNLLFLKATRFFFVSFLGKQQLF